MTTTQHGKFKVFRWGRVGCYVNVMSSAMSNSKKKNIHVISCYYCCCRCQKLSESLNILIIILIKVAIAVSSLCTVFSHDLNNFRQHKTQYRMLK